MRKDPTEFRRRFEAYKNGKMPYENGLPKYEDGLSFSVEDALKYIMNIENKYNVGLSNGIWRRPTDPKKYDVNQIAWGLDTRQEHNQIVYNFLKSKGRLDDPWLTLKEAHDLMLQTFNAKKSALDKLVSKYPGKISQAGYNRLASMLWHGHPFKMINTPDSTTAKAFLNAIATGDADMESVFDAYYIDPINNPKRTRLFRERVAEDHRLRENKPKSFIQQSMLNTANAAMRTYSARQPRINGGNAPLAITEDTDNGKVMYIDWGDEDLRYNQPQWMPEEPRTVDYSIGERAPESILGIPEINPLSGYKKGKLPEHSDGSFIENNILAPVSAAAMNLVKNLAIANKVSDSQLTENGTAQDTYLLSRDAQRRQFLNNGYTEAPGDYGLVKNAVGGRDLPVYQKNPDVINRSNIFPIGNISNIWLGSDATRLEHPGNFPSAIYTDGHGNYYQKAWDLNDYGNASGGTSYGGLMQYGANLLDAIGSPTVVTTGYQKIEDPFHPDMEKIMRAKGLVKTKMDDGSFQWTLPDPVILPRHKKGKLPKFAGGLFDELYNTARNVYNTANNIGNSIGSAIREVNAPNIYRRSDGSYFYKGDNGDVNVTPIMTSLSDDPAHWTYVDDSGNRYVPRQLLPSDQGTVTPEDRTFVERAWDDYFGKLKYKWNNDEVIGGEYTMPAIGAAAAASYLNGAVSGVALPSLAELVALAGKNIWGTAARDFALSILTGETINEASNLITGNSFGKNVNILAGGYVPETVGNFLNPGYYFGGDVLQGVGRNMRDFTKSIPNYLKGAYKYIMAPKRANALSQKMLDFYKNIEEQAVDSQTPLFEETINRGAALRDAKSKYDDALQDAQLDIGRAMSKKADLLRTPESEDPEYAIRNYITRFKKPEKLLAAYRQALLNNNLTATLRANLQNRIKHAEAANLLEKALDDHSSNMPDFSKMSVENIIDFINANSSLFNFSKGFDPKLIADKGVTKDIYGLLDLLLKSGFEIDKASLSVIDKEGLIPFSTIFKTGQFDIPLFGSNASVSGNVSVLDPGLLARTRIIDLIRSISDKSIKPVRENILQNSSYKADVPEAYKNALKHNIQYLREMFPGAKEFGSSTVAADAGTPHVTHDIDLIISDADFINSVEKLFGSRFGDGWRVSSKPNGTGYEDTYTHSLGDEYGEAGDIDFNIIYTDPDTGMASAKMGTRALELFKLFFPEDYKQAVLASMKGMPLIINKTPQQLIERYDPVTKTILDSFSSSKPKHVSRAEAHLTTTDPEKVAKALDLYAQEKLGGSAQHLPITEDMFKNVELNRRIFKDLGYKGVDEETVVNDPAKMKNLVDYWYIHNSIFGRGVDSGSIDNTLFKPAAIDNSFRDWRGYGGNVNGPGLNTVTLGDSSYGDVYGFIQPKLKFNGEQTAEDIISSAKRQLGHPSYKFTDSEKLLIQLLLDDNGIYCPMQHVNTPEQLLQSLPTDPGTSKLFLQQLSDKLGIRALSKSGLYSGGRYNSMTGLVNQEDALMYGYRDQQEMPVSDIIRDRKTADETSISSEALKRSLVEKGHKWAEKHSGDIIGNNLLIKKYILPKTTQVTKYESRDHRELSNLAKRKVNRNDPNLKKDYEQALQAYDKADLAFDRAVETSRTARSRIGKAQRIQRDALMLMNKIKDILYLVGGGIASASGLVALINHGNRPRTKEEKEAIKKRLEERRKNRKKQ